MKRYLFLFPFLLVFGLLGCEQMVEYSPYDVRVRVTNVNKKNISRIESLEADLTGTDTFTFAVISDPHTFYADLADAVSSINANNQILFTIVTGDITDAGLFKEFDWEYHHISKLKQPFVTVIGNHDYLSNGKAIYRNMYGDSNFIFQFKGTKFIMFDDIVWENNNNRPDFEWLQQELNGDIAYSNRLVFAHIPPVNDQLDGEYGQTFREVIKDHVRLMFCGHHHNYEDNQMDGFRYIVVGSVSRRYYSVVTVAKDTVVTQKVNF